MNGSGKRYIGLDMHKYYLIALVVDADLNVVLPARRVEFSYLETWMKKTLTKQDEVVLEMTTTTWQVYDELVEYVACVRVVHPPHVALITRSQVLNDKIAASILARLLAKGLLVGSGGTTAKDDAAGHPGEEPPTCGAATSPPESARWQSICESQ